MLLREQIPDLHTYANETALVVACLVAAVSQRHINTPEKGIKLREGDGRERLILLCHYNEGRVLLTDEDGMYNDFITEACRVSGK